MTDKEEKVRKFHKFMVASPLDCRIVPLVVDVLFLGDVKKESILRLRFTLVAAEDLYWLIMEAAVTPLQCVNAIMVTMNRTNSLAAEKRLRCLLLERVDDDALEEEEDDKIVGELPSLTEEDVVN